jgi:hypothetical protein
MSLIILLYVLPLLLSTGMLYYFMKQDGESVGDFLSMAIWTIIPLLNIGIFLLMILYAIDKWTNFGEKWEEFKNRKL